MKTSTDTKAFLKTLFYLAPPVIFQEVLGAFVNIIDTIMIGRRMGIHEVTAVGLANQIFFLFILMIFGIISGSSVFIGQFWGKGDKKGVHKIMGIGFTLNTLVASLYFCLAFFIPEVLMSVYSSDPIVIELGAEYLRVISFSYLLIAITFTRNSAMRSIGQTRIPMVTTCIALVCNFILNYIFIFILETGLGGVALGTLISRGIELIVQQILIKKYNIPIDTKIKNYFDFNVTFVKKFFKVSIFIILNEIIWSFGVTTYNIAYGHAGTEAQGAVQISNAMMQIFQVFGNSIAITSSIIISNTLGKGEVNLAIKYSRKCIYSALLISSVMAALLLIFAPIIVGFYNVEPEVEGLITKILYVSAIGMILKSVNFTSLIGVLRSGGDTKFCFYLEVMAVWLIGVPLAFIGAIYLDLPIYIIVLLIHIEELVKFFIALKRVYNNKWANTIV